jgi:hypothetical protein
MKFVLVQFTVTELVEVPDDMDLARVVPYARHHLAEKVRLGANSTRIKVSKVISARQIETARTLAEHEGFVCVQ